jgi:hypothetical protein
MGTKVSKDTREHDNNNEYSQKISDKSVQSQTKSSDTNLDSKLKAKSSTNTVTVKQSTGSSASTEKITKKKNESQENHVDITANQINPNVKESDENGRSGNLRSNPKKGKLITDQLSSKESEILKTIKKQNKEFEDSNFIDGLLTKHFFMRVLDKQSR